MVTSQTKDVLTEVEKDRFASYTTHTYDKSLSSKLMAPLWERVASCLPEELAPNMISVAGLLCLVQAWYLCFTQGEEVS